MSDDLETFFLLVALELGPPDFPVYEGLGGKQALGTDRSAFDYLQKFIAMAGTAAISLHEADLIRGYQTWYAKNK